MSVLSVQNVEKDFPTRSEPLRVLRSISFDLDPGENLAILGPSGSGKSTLLHIIGTLDQPTAGRVTLDGEDPFKLPEQQLADFRNLKIGFIFQDHHLLGQCTVLENVLIPTIAKGRSSAAAEARARDLIGRVGLSDRMDHRPSELSGGERQRVAIARALIHGPRLLLADEPTGNLDRSTAADISNLLLDMQREESTMLIVVTHSLDLAARLQKQMELDAGRLREPT